MGALSSAQVRALTTDQVVGLTQQQVAALSNDQVDALDTAQIGAMETRDLVAMTALSESLFRSPEAAEGMRAFAEKRPPSWALPADPKGT